MRFTAISVSSGRVTAYLAAVAVFVLTSNPQTSAAPWQIETVHSPATAGWRISIDVDPAGYPAASYFTTQQNASDIFARRDATGWHELQTISSGLAFAFDNAGSPYFLHRSGQKPELLGTGIPSTPIESVPVSENAFLDFDTQNYPHVAYIDTNSRTLRDASWNGTQWTIRSVATASNFLYGNSFFYAALDHSNQAHYFYAEAPDNFRGPMYYGQPTSSGWNVLPIAGLSGYPLDMAIDSTGRPNIVFQDLDNKLQYGRYDGSTWIFQSFGSGHIRQVDLALDQFDHPNIFIEGENSLQYAILTTSGFALQTVATWSGQITGPEAVAATIVNQRIHVMYSTDGEQVFYATQPVPEPNMLLLLGLAIALNVPSRKRRAASSRH